MSPKSEKVAPIDSGVESVEVVKGDGEYGSLSDSANRDDASAEESSWAYPGPELSAKESKRESFWEGKAGKGEVRIIQL